MEDFGKLCNLPYGRTYTTELKSLSQIKIQFFNGDLEHLTMDMESDDVEVPQNFPIQE